ncbi:histidine acid phosphatase [Oesophagostomum dentatum]|uniref:Histidine acid phosphatase n=1 Tax=Oesophagostomum dentatum TaxID=61180 RepID=A0A0B1THZ3_OESDE|nr:histidine acid phosphatase [Oesophagostomum dentatum]
MKISWQQLQRLTSFLLCCIPVKTDKELVFVQAVWRHGDRAPLGYPYPEDPYNETAWPRGWSQLTNLGMQQMYELGTFFRQRYNNLINQNYVDEEVGIFFSNSDRTANSAQAFAFGFYPAQGSFQWQEGNSWQPTPLRQGSDLVNSSSPSLEAIGGYRPRSFNQNVYIFVPLCGRCSHVQE